jgi:hypothetical protein
MLAFISFPSSYSSAASLPNNMTYTIYTYELSNVQYNIDSSVPSLTNYLYTDSPESYCRSSQYTYLYTSLFNPIKHAIDMTLIMYSTGTYVNASTQVQIQNYFCPEYKNDILKSRFSFFITILIQFAYIFTLIVNIGNIIIEKETKMKVIRF